MTEETNQVETPTEKDATELSEAEKILIRTEKAVAEQKIQNDRREKINQDEQILRTLGGKAGGKEPAVKEKTEDEMWEEDAKQRYEGTGMDPTPDNTPTEFR